MAAAEAIQRAEVLKGTKKSKIIMFYDFGPHLNLFEFQQLIASQLLLKKLGRATETLILKWTTMRKKKMMKRQSKKQQTRKLKWIRFAAKLLKLKKPLPLI